jgi:hypothetical protein
MSSAGTVHVAFVQHSCAIRAAFVQDEGAGHGGARWSPEARSEAASELSCAPQTSDQHPREDPASSIQIVP